MTSTPDWADAIAADIIGAYSDVFSTDRDPERAALIATELRRVADEARREERDACCRAVCAKCGSGRFMWGDPAQENGVMWVHRSQAGVLGSCAASAIRASVKT